VNLKHLTDQTLLTRTEELTEKSRRDLVELLWHLREIDRRRLYSSLKLRSLFEYMTVKLRFSESEACRRISAMRVLQELPEAEGRLKSGEISLTNLVLARALFLKEKKRGRAMSLKEKGEVLMSIGNQSTREVKKVLSKINPEMMTSKPLDFDGIEDDCLREKLLKARGLMGNGQMSLTELLHKLCDDFIEASHKSPAAAKVNSKAERQRALYRRGQCDNCGSTHRLERDHRIPKAAGGGDGPENMRLLCRSCNQRAAIEFYGMEKMGLYLKSPAVDYQVRRGRENALSADESVIIGPAIAARWGRWDCKPKQPRLVGGANRVGSFACILEPD
jgi:hypothetical protein